MVDQHIEVLGSALRRARREHDQFLLELEFSVSLRRRVAESLSTKKE